MVTDGRWKYVWSQEGPLEELYDLQNDPTELVNLATRPNAQKELALWRERLIAEAKHVGDNGLFDANGKLATSPLDRESFRKLPITAMGWRWF
jgi:arylsulfatase A-like enzyme